eukprot:4674877-Prymnesium_polylepis.1
MSSSRGHLRISRPRRYYAKAEDDSFVNLPRLMMRLATFSQDEMAIARTAPLLYRLCRGTHARTSISCSLLPVLLSPLPARALLPYRRISSLRSRSTASRNDLRCARHAGRALGVGGFISPDDDGGASSAQKSREDCRKNVKASPNDQFLASGPFSTRSQRT